MIPSEFCLNFEATLCNLDFQGKTDFYKDLLVKFVLFANKSILDVLVRKPYFCVGGSPDIL